MPAWAWQFERYISRIRNDAKREYARAYYAHLLAKRYAAATGDGPARPASLSFMAAQAVRQRLDALMEQ